MVASKLWFFIFFFVVTILLGARLSEGKYLLVKLLPSYEQKAAPKPPADEDTVDRLTQRAKVDPRVRSARWLSGPVSTYGADLGDLPQYNMNFYYWWTTLLYQPTHFFRFGKEGTYLQDLGMELKCKLHLSPLKRDIIISPRGPTVKYTLMWNEMKS